MANKKLFIILFGMFVLFFILVSIESSKESFTESFTPVESFTPGLRKIYRPYIRSGRIYTEKMYNNLSNQLHVILSKLGVI